MEGATDGEIQIIISSGNTFQLKILLENGLDANHVIKELSMSLLVYSVYSNEVEIATLLLRNGANVNSNDLDGCFALHVASRRNRYVLVSILINAGSNIDEQTSIFKDTPLHLACIYSAYEALCLLAEKGASLTIVNSGGLTPVQEASERCHKKECCSYHKEYSRSYIYLAHTIPNRIARCQHAVMTLIWTRQVVVAGHWGAVDRHNVLAIAKLVWQSRRQPIWD